MKKSVIAALVLAVIFTAGIMVSGFVSANSATVNTAEKKSAYVITSLTPNVTATIKVGGKFIVALKENATTGYVWSYKISNEKGIAIYSETALEALVAPTTPIMGAGIDKVWEFSALKAGTYTITYQYKRAWEEKAIEKLTYKVIIKK